MFNLQELFFFVIRQPLTPFFASSHLQHLCPLEADQLRMAVERLSMRRPAAASWPSGGMRRLSVRPAVSHTRLIRPPTLSVYTLDTLLQGRGGGAHVYWHSRFDSW